MDFNENDSQALGLPQNGAGSLDAELKIPHL